VRNKKIIEVNDQVQNFSMGKDIPVL